MKRRLEQALADADEAESILPLIREAVRKYGFEPRDVFDAGSSSVAKMPSSLPKRDRLWCK